MFMARRPACVAAALALWAAPVLADDQCLTPAERRAAVSGGQAIPFAQAQRALRPEHRGEVLQARLCRSDAGMVYLLTVMQRHGKVVRIRVDAKSGQIVQVR
jgi:uncharacterized membrane protein YkoI